MALPHRTTCVLLFICCLLAGCGGSEPITSYTVPREPEPKEPTGPYGILGAMYPEAEPVWYFKFAGSNEDLAQHQADWDKLIASVKYKDSKTVPEFTLPAGWVNIGERVRTSGTVTNTTQAVLKIGSKDSPLEVTVNYNAGGLVQNLDRWANTQLGNRFSESKLESKAKPFDAAGGKGLRVDLRGPNNPAGGPMMKR